MIDGLNERTTSGGVQVLRLHYSSDPGKRPGTEVGDVWLDAASKGYIGGMGSSRRFSPRLRRGLVSGPRVRFSAIVKYPQVNGHVHFV